jgi:hypothetical protein
VWNDNGVMGYFAKSLGSLGAGGGGCSTLFSAPGWQTNLSVWPSTGCGADRLEADVAAVADYLTGFDVYDSYTCTSGCVPSAGWYTIGGTSLASPVIAGVYGLGGGAHGISYPALLLYGHPGKGYDVTSGGNGYCDGEGAGACGNPNSLGSAVIDCDYNALGALAAGDRACDALAGFDGPTGMGTPNGLRMFMRISPQAKISGPTSIAHSTSGTWTATTADPFPGGTISSYTWMWGDGTTTSTTTGSASHTYSTAGSYTITLRVQDNYGVTGSVTYAVSVT